MSDDFVLYKYPWQRKKKRKRIRKFTDVATPFVAIGHGEKAPWSDLPNTCPVCGAECELQDSDPPGLQYISHCGKTWLRGEVKFRSLKEADEAYATTAAE